MSSIMAGKEMANNKWGAIGAAVYFISSLGIVFANKTLYEKYPYPMAVCWIQQLFGLIAGFASQLLYLRTGITNAVFPPISFNLKDIGMSLGAVVFFVGYTAFANYALQFCNISAFLVARSATLPVTFGLSLLLLQGDFVKKQYIGAFLVVSGFVSSVFDYETLNAKSLECGFISSIFQGSYVVASKYVQNHMSDKNHMIIGTYIWSTLLYPIAFLWLEGPQSITHAIAGDAETKILLFFSTIFGIGITWGVYTIIYNFSPVTYEIVAICKAIVQTALAVIVMGDPLTGQLILSIGLVLYGSWIYTKASRDKEEEEKQIELPEINEADNLELSVADNMPEADHRRD